MKYSRADYLTEKCSHREYYGQFVTRYIKEHLCLAIGKDKIIASLDPHFNDISLALWDNLPGYHSMADGLRDAGDYLTLSGKVGIYKEAARQIREAQ